MYDVFTQILHRISMGPALDDQVDNSGKLDQISKVLWKGRVRVNLHSLEEAC